MLQGELGQRQESEQTWAKCLEHAGVAHARAPNVVVYRRTLAARFINRGVSRRNRGDFDSALDDLRRSREVDPDSETLYLAAANLAMFSALIDANRDQLPPERLAERDEFNRQALEWLAEAVDSGFRDHKRLESDAKWERLHDLPAFAAQPKGLQNKDSRPAEEAK